MDNDVRFLPFLHAVDHVLCATRCAIARKESQQRVSVVGHLIVASEASTLMIPYGGTLLDRDAV